MRRASRGGVAALLLAILSASAACARKADDAAPVATPTVTLSRGDGAVGSPVDMNYTFKVAADAPAFTDDYWVFVHFLNKDGELMWTDDHQPPTPTRQWKPGRTVAYQRTMFIPKFPYVGEATVQLGLFSMKTGDRLPLAGDNAGMRSYRVARFDMRLQADSLFVVFGDGWHDTEASDDGTGLEWQWSKKEGALSFRNPKQDVVLFLQADQPVAALPVPQQVEVRLGSAAVDHFPVPPGQRILRRIPITAAQLGTADTVAMTVAVDQTFTPAAVPQLKSSDARELGIRVFRAYLQPAVEPKK
jgi:hypothetical protein